MGRSSRNGGYNLADCCAYEEIPLGVYQSRAIDYDGVDEKMLDTMIGHWSYIRSQVGAIRNASGRYLGIVDSYLHNICKASENVEAHIRILKNESK